jgi:hypothetical protein
VPLVPPRIPAAAPTPPVLSPLPDSGVSDHKEQKNKTSWDAGVVERRAGGDAFQLRHRRNSLADAHPSGGGGKFGATASAPRTPSPRTND